MCIFVTALKLIEISLCHAELVKTSQCLWWPLSSVLSYPISIQQKKRGYVGHRAPYFELAVCSVEKSFFRKQTGFGTQSQSFQTLIWPHDLPDRRLPVTTLPSLTSFFFSQFHIKDFSVFPLLFSWRGFNLNEDVSGGGWRMSVFLLVLFSADAFSRSPTWGYLWLP